MDYSSTTTVASGSSMDGNTAGRVSSPAFARLWARDWLTNVINRRSIAAKERHRVDRVRKRRYAHPRLRSQNGGGAYVYFSTLAVTGGSSIDDNAANVSSPAFALASGFVVGLPGNQPTLGRCERETFAIIEHEGDAVLAHASARRREEAHMCMTFPH